MAQEKLQGDYNKLKAEESEKSSKLAELSLQVRTVFAAQHSECCGQDACSVDVENLKVRLSICVLEWN